MNAQRALLLVGLAAVAACDLDVDSKPECVTDEDCREYNEREDLFCIAQTCEQAEAPQPALDQFYAQGSPSTGAPITVTGPVLANDTDPDGLALSIQSVSPGSSVAAITQVDATSVTLTVTGLPAFAFYTVGNGIAPPVQQSIDVIALPLAVTVPVPTHAATDLGAVLAVDPGIVELTVPPMHGTVAGGGPGLYTPEATFCGDDQATYTVHAANADLQVIFTFDVALPLFGEAVTGDFSAPTTIDVLANDGSGLELVSTSSPYAQITNDNQLIVTPPLNVAQSYDISYVARDGSGHEGAATLHFTVEFPTEVLVGDAIAGDAFDPVLSTDGRFLAFVSTDDTLVPGDTNGTSDVFVQDLETGAIERMSIGSDGTQANGASSSPTISADGRYVAFVSEATNLDARDHSSVDDIYLHDRQTGATTLVSVGIDNAGSPQPSTAPQLSADGSRVVFASASPLLVANDTNDVEDVFVRTVAAETTQRISTDPAGSQPTTASYDNPRISGDGHVVAVETIAGIYLVGVDTSSVDRVDADGNAVFDFDIDATGRHLVYLQNGDSRIYDRLAVAVTTMSTSYSYSFGVTPDGTHAVFSVSNPTQIMAWSATAGPKSAIVDRQGAAVTATPLRRPVLSADGRWIVFATAQWPGHVGQLVIVRVWNPTYAP